MGPISTTWTARTNFAGINKYKETKEMSAIIGLIAAAVVTGVLLPTGVKLISASFNRITGKIELDSNGFVAGGSEAIGRSEELKPIRSVSRLDLDFKAISSSISSSMSTDRAKDVMLTALAAQPFYASDTAAIEQKVEALKSSATIREVEKAGRQLFDSVIDANDAVFGEAVHAACQRAAVKNGFSKIESLPNSNLPGTIRFSATDSAGRTIVTELSARRGRDLKIESEVIGVSDGSCNEILDLFCEELKAEGIVSRGEPDRKSTGGICNLAASRIFMDKKIPVTAPRRRKSTADAKADGNGRKRLSARHAAATKPIIS